MNFKSAISRSLFLIFLIISIFLSVGCFAKDDGLSEEKRAQVVKVVEMKEESIDFSDKLSGVLMPFDYAAVVAQADGEVTEVRAQIGDRVAVNDLLAVIDKEFTSLQYDQAKVGVMQAEGQLAAARAGVAAAEANLDMVVKGASDQERKQAENQVAQAEAAYNKYKLDADRYAQLLEHGAIAVSDFENIMLQLDNAEKNYDSAKQSLERVQLGATPEQIRATEATLAQAEAGLIQAQAGYENALILANQAALALDKTDIKATISGVILDKQVSQGQMIGAGSHAYTIANIDKLKVALPIPDNQYYSWQVGDEVVLDLYGKKKIAILDRLYPMASMGTGAISGEVVIDNTDHEWMPGQVVSAVRASSESSGLLIATEAVVSFGDKPYVFRVLDGRAHKTTVELASKMVDNKFQIISGLSAGDQVVTQGADKLFDGDEIELLGE